MLYYLCYKEYPFYGENYPQVIQRIINSPLEFPKNSLLSEDTKDLISLLLEKDPDSRIDGNSALNHRLFSRTGSPRVQLISPDIVNSLKSFHRKSSMQKEVYKVITKYINCLEETELKAAFMSLDKDNNGYLTYEGLETALSSSEQVDMKQIIKDLDYNADGKITYSEFLAASLSHMTQMNEELIQAAFTHFDRDNSGFITPDDLSIVFAHQGFAIHRNDLLELLKAQHINYAEFKQLLLNR